MNTFLQSYINESATPNVTKFMGNKRNFELKCYSYTTTIYVALGIS